MIFNMHIVPVVPSSASTKVFSPSQRLVPFAVLNPFYRRERQSTQYQGEIDVEDIFKNLFYFLKLFPFFNQYIFR